MKILRVHMKGKSCNSAIGLQFYYKETSTRVFSREYPGFLEQFFYRTTTMATFELCLVSERTFNKESFN